VKILDPKLQSLGSLTVQRSLPSRERRMVGPFIFFDHVAAVDVAAGVDSDVRPHPHIGLATVTVMFEGALVHRDSLGNKQVITLGDINWMTAGQGIVHSERSRDDEKQRARRVHLLQLWCALPDGKEDIAPTFEHHEAASLPSVDVDGVAVRVLAGSAFARTSPVTTLSPLFYVDLRVPAGKSLDLGTIAYQERGLFVLTGEAEVDGVAVPREHIAIVDGGGVLRAQSDVHAVALGGEPVGPRHAWWNFVHSSKDRIAEAREDWRARKFARIPGDDVEFVPLPEGA
jgi:redox-sensitive bicupin YhaK (pirin superfamily)